MRESSRAQKAIAVAVCSSLILTAPGLPVYQVFAARFVAPQAGKVSVPVGSAVGPVVPVNSLSTSLNAVNTAIQSGLTGALPSVGGAQAAISPTASLNLPLTAETAQAVPQGVASKAILQRAETSETAPRGLFNVLVHGIRGDEKDAPQPAEAEFLTVSQKTLNSPIDSKSWGARSFDSLRGMVSGRTGANIPAVPASRTAQKKNGLRPASATEGRAKKTAVPAVSDQKKGKGTVAMWGTAALMGALPLANLDFGGMWSSVVGFFTSGGIFAGMSWPVIIGAQIALAITMHYGKKWLKNRKERKKKDAEKQVALEDLHPVTLEGDKALAAAVAASKDKKIKVHVFNFVTTGFHDIDLTPEILEGIRDGAYHVTTDDTGALYLVPRVSGADKAAAPAPAPAETQVKKAEGVEVEPVAEKSIAPAVRREGKKPGLAGAQPRSFKNLPGDAQVMNAGSIMAAKAAAQSRARKVAKDARLLRVAINLDDPRAHPVFIFHSPRKNKILTVWEKRIGVKSARGMPKAQTLWNSRLAQVRSLESAYAALKQDAPRFKPARVELVSKWNQDPQYVFRDARGRVRTVPAVIRENPETPADEPGTQLPAPPQENLPPGEEIPGDEARPPPGDIAKPPPGEAAPAEPHANSPHIREDFLGFRRVQGLKHDSSLQRLPDDADTPRIIRQLSLQFNISYARVMELAEDYGLSLSSDRAAWLSVYDRLQTMNREEFKQFDQKKYEGSLLGETVSRLFVALGWRKKVSEAGFRKLANRKYPEGLAGALGRALELHKHLVGFIVRVPYHLFDMFLFGYFRRNIAFEFGHNTEDFITLRARETRRKMEEKGELTEEEEILMPSAEKWIKGAMGHYKAKGIGMKGNIFSGRGARFLRRYFLTPVFLPLFEFVWRRATLAVFSAVAMGFIAGALPLSLLSFHLTAVPVLGQALVWLGHGLPIFLSHVPYFGGSLSSIVGAGATALIADLSVGAIFNVLALSTMLTFPAVAKQRLMDQRGMAYQIPPIFSMDFALGVAGTAISWAFWSKNLQSMLGLMTVGAEIEGIMTYAGEIDGFFNQAYQPLTGSEFRLFHTIGAAVERPEGSSPIPFGGAITWGNILIYKLQAAVGLNITDTTYDIVHRGLYGVHGLEATDVLETAMVNKDSLGPVLAGQGVVASMAGMAMTRGGGGPEGFKKGTGAEMAARQAAAREDAGDIDREIARIKARISELEESLGLKNKKLEELNGLSRPLSKEEEAEYRRAVLELEKNRDTDYIQSKLAEIYDLEHPTEPLGEGVPLSDDPASQTITQAKRLQALNDLKKYYDSILLDDTGGTGRSESLGVKKAVLESLSNAVEGYRNPAKLPKGPDRGVAEEISEATQARLRAMVGELEDLRGEVKGELTNRNALGKLLGVINRSRNAALSERRGGDEMLKFHKNLAKLATVMDLALSLNEIEAAQTAIKQMEAMLNDKLAKIQGVRDQAAQDLANAQNNLGRNEEWTQDAKKKIEDSKASLSDMQELELQTRGAVERIAEFRTKLNTLLGKIDAEDNVGSPSALAEYNRRKALLPTLVDWYSNGKPGDEDFKSLKSLNDKLVEVQDFITKVGEGLDKVASAPVEFAGVLVVGVPGVPEVTLSNPSTADTLAMLADRKAHWQTELADYTKIRDDLRERLSATFTGTEADDFGDVYPISLPKRLAQAQADVAKYTGQARTFLQQMDAEAAGINAYVPGANLPALAGMTLEQLKDALDAYKDQLKGLNFPNESTNENHNAKMNLLKLGLLLPQAAREVIQWAKADAQIQPIQDALVSPVPQAAALYENVVTIVQGLIADIDKDVADVQAGFPDKQGIIDRKRALLQTVLPVLQEAKTVISQHAIPFQNDAIATFDPNGDKFAKLFKNQIDLFEGTQEALSRTLPWSLASNGAKDGDKPGGMAKIAKQQERYTDLLNGSDDAEGHHDGILELLDKIERRLDPNNNETEEVYGRTQFYSLPKSIAANQAEKIKRAQQINAKHGEINSILTRIDGLTNGKFNLAARHLPTNISAADPASVAVLDALVDTDKFTQLGTLLTDIGNEYKDKGSATLAGEENAGTVPTGVQATPTVDDATMVALLSLEAAKRLVPSTNQSGHVDDGSAVFAVAEFLFADGFIDSAEKNLHERIPVAQAFIQQAQAGLNQALADLVKDEAFVQSDGSSETSDQVIDRKIAIYGLLNAVTRTGVTFYGQKVLWDTDGLDTVDRVKSFYEAHQTINENSETAGESEVSAINKIKDALKATFDDLEEQRIKINGWMGQLNDPRESALRRVADGLSEIQDKTRAVLEQNVNYHDIKSRYERGNDSLDWALRRSDKVQRDLARELRGIKDLSSLDPKLAKRIQDLRIHGGMYSMGGTDSAEATSALVIPKRDFGRFVQTLFLGFLERAPSTVNLAGLQQQLLQNPNQLTNIIPNTEMIDFGDADGFYLVYKSNFSVPHGLETSNWVTLGNVAKLWGNNISVTGYQFASPPNDENAPWGDKGIEIQVESVQGKKWVNYFNIDFHRFIQDIPPDTTIQTSARQSRLMVFEDFAMLLFGDKLYIGLTGFADIAAQDTKDKTSFYGGSIKTEWKFTEVMSLTAEQQRIVANDPRYFLKTMNLDFTGLDPDLNRDFTIEAHGDNKDYTRTKLGPRLNVAKLLKSNDTFTVDMFWSRVEGTDDYNQDSIGVSVLKGFTIRDDKGKPWMIINNKAGYEKGDKFNSLSDRVSVTLPNQGIVIGAEGRLIGDAKTYFFDVNKKTGDHSSASLSYGSRYVGQEPRLTIGLNSSFTLGELWSTVTRESADALDGSKALSQYNKDFDEFFKDEAADSKKIAELRKVYLRDIGVKLVKQDIGLLSKEITELRKAGAVLDNTRVRGMVGFVTNAVGDSLADRAVGGGFVAGTQTTFELTKTQKALIESKVETLYRESMRLQFRMLELTKEWQQTVVDIAQAQWELKMAHAKAEFAPTEALRRAGMVEEAQAESALKQAAIRYNMLSGRSPDEKLPFDNLSSNDVRELLAEIKTLVAMPDRMVQILHMLDKEQIAGVMGKDPFNVIDWIPWIDKLTFSFGAQFQDYMANQIIGLGVTVRLPVYDPASKEQDKAYRLESQAVNSEMQALWREYSLKAAKERQDTRIWTADAQNLAPHVDAAHAALGNAIRAYRNGLIGDKRMREAFDQWNWYVAGILDSESKAVLSAGWEVLDGSFGKPPEGSRENIRVESFQDAFDEASKKENSKSLEEIAFRQQAAAHRTAASDHRINKFYVELFAGSNFTAEGVGWLPSIGVTGLAVTPVLSFELKPEELRELQVRQAAGQEKYFAQFKTKVEADLAFDIYKHVVALNHSERSIAVLRDEIIPGLEKDLARARAGARDGDPEGNVPRAQKELDLASRRLLMARQVYQHAYISINFLLGRPADAPMDVELTPTQALYDLKEILRSKQPVATDRAILDSRVEVAKAVELMIDKDLKLQNLRFEPVALAVRSLARLLSALSEEGIGNPERVAAARIQTLEAERVREAYERQRVVRFHQTEAELNAAQSALRRVEGKTDAESRLQAIEIENKIFILQATLARFGGEAQRQESGRLPSSYRDLKDGILDAEQGLAAAGRESDVEIFTPEIMTNRSESNARFYNARKTLGGDPIDKNYIESWVEFRLRDPETPAEVLLALAKLRTDKANRINRNLNAAARSSGMILLSQFEMNVRLLRWVNTLGGEPQAASFTENVDKFKFNLNSQLSVQADRIKALLDLPKSTTVEDLARLMPADPDGKSGDLSIIASRFVGQVESLQIDQIRKTLFEGGVPVSLGNEDSLIHQIRSDVIAERMSYNGFTPVAAYGIFRAHPVGGIFMEAPDPRSIERGLQQVLSESLRKELLSQGRMQELSQRLHLLMSSVSEKAKIVERQHALIESAKTEFRNALARAGSPDSQETASAQKALVAALLDFSVNIADLKNDFIRLVTELEAIGIPAENLITPGARSKGFEPVVTKDTGRERMVSYASRRTLDQGFAEALFTKLESISALPPEALKDLRAAVRNYQVVDDTAETIRYHKDFDAAKRLQLLTKLDVEGRRQAVDAVLLKVVATLEGNEALRQDFAGYMIGDIESQIGDTEILRSKDVDLVQGMREFYAENLELSYEMKGAVMRLEKLHRAVIEAKQKLLKDYTDGALRPEDILLQARALDGYLKAVTAYDDEVLQTFNAAELKDNTALVQSLQGLYKVRETIARQQALVRSGRGLLALDALIMLENARLLAMRWERARSSDIDRVVASLENLKSMRERWFNKNAAELAPLYVVTAVAESGARLWTTEGWFTEAEVIKKIEDKELTREDGRIWMKGKPGQPRMEVVAGLDVAVSERDRSLGGLEQNSGRLKLFELFKEHEFAIVSLDGRRAEGLSYQDAEALAGKGAMFHFNRNTAKNDLQHAQHPLRALWSNPADTVTLLYRGEQSYSRDRFPTMESLTDYLRQLRQSGPDGAAQADKFYVLEAGPEGIKTMIRHARTHAIRSERRGWMGVKLQSFGFAVQDGKSPEAIYTTEEDFNAAVRALDDASGILAEARKKLAGAKAEEHRTRAIMDARKARLDEESLHYQGVQTVVRARIQKELDADFPAREGESTENRDARKKAELNKRVVSDKDYIKAQGRHAAELETFNKAHEDFMDKFRAADKALEDLTKAGMLTARAGLWTTHAESYLRSLQDAGVPEKIDPKRPDKLSVEGQAQTLSAVRRWSLYVTRDAVLRIDEENQLVGLSGRPVIGDKPLSVTLGEAQGALRHVGGEVFAAIMDTDQRLVKLFMDPDVVEEAGKTWALADQKILLSYQDEREARKNIVADRGDLKTVDPNYRLRYYVDPASELPVLLNRRYLMSRLVDSGQELARVNSWGVGPWNWGNILMEIPRGVLGTPLELFLGRDPNQQGYIGRVNMQKIEGGATNHHGFFRKALGVIDFLDIMPDPVDWYFDSSQFPDKVRVDSPVGPGQNIYDKNSTAGKKDIHYGRKYVERTIVYEVEDLVNAGQRVRSYFAGGVQDTWLEDRRGRERVVATSRVKETQGRASLEEALDDALIGAHPNSDGRGTVRLGGVPGHIEVDRIERFVKIRPGAQQYALIARELAKLPELLDKNFADVHAATKGLKEAFENAKKAYDASLVLRDSLSRAERAAWEKVHEMEWRIGRQRAIEAAIAKLTREIAQIQDELAQLRKRLAELERERGEPTDPDWPRFPDLSKWWWWLITGAFLLSILAAVWEWLSRRRRPLPAPPGSEENSRVAG